MHGGKSPGAPRGEANGNYRTREWTKEAIAFRREISDMNRRLNKALKEMKEAM